MPNALLPRLGLLGALLLLAACETPGALEAAGTIEYAPTGTRIELLNVAGGTTSTTVIIVAGAEGTEGRYTGIDGEIGSYFPGCWGCGGQMTIDRAEYDKLWPLEVGKVAQFERKGPDGRPAQVTIRVVGTERIETPMGTLETKILQGRLESGSYWANLRSWWSDKIGWVVRSEGVDSSGYGVSSRVVKVTGPR